MGQALQLVAGFATNAGATFTVATAATPDTFAVQNFATTDAAYLEQIWGRGATPGIIRIRSPRFHDPNQGIRVQVGSTLPYLGLPYGVDEQLYPGDTPIVDLTGGGAETDTVYVLYGYANLPGATARYGAWADIQPRIQHISGVQVNPVTSATAGQWGNARAINADFDNFKAGMDYAILGYVPATSVGAVAFSGVETGNFKVGGPGPVDHIQTRDFFIQLSQNSGRPYIPIFNANNKAAFNVFVNDAAISATCNVTVYCAQLGS